MPASLVLEGVCKEFGAGQERVAAVRDISFQVQEGELFTLLGPSGCGKTTTLRLIAGLETPSAGKIVFGGQDFTSLPPFRRNLGMVFQSYALYPHMMYGGRVVQVGTPTEVYEAPASVGVADFLGKANFLQAEVVGRAHDRIRVRLASGGVFDVVQGDPAWDPAEGDAATLFIRPERVRMSNVSSPVSRPGRR